MNELLKIRKFSQGKHATDGAGVKLVRVIGYHDTAEYDPFLMLDAFDSKNPDDYTKGFPWHPHRGIETITYLISGEIEHSDSLGNRGVIRDGDCQWMTAGSGIIHQEMPKASKHMLGAQLWLNLPARDKMTEPKYGEIRSEDIPEIDEDTAHIRVLSGRYRDVVGAFAPKHVLATYLDVKLDANGQWTLDVSPDDTVFAYIFEGSAKFSPDGETVDAKQAVLFEHGKKLWVLAGEDGIRMIILSAKPLKEPIAWGGPIVMNTKTELNLAFREIDEGSFIKHK